MLGAGALVDAEAWTPKISSLQSVQKFQLFAAILPVR
jgi:hypothetical protein